MIRVEVLRRSMYGGYMGKVYEFKSRRHMEAWVEKWFIKLGVDQFNIIEDKTNEKEHHSQGPTGGQHID